MNAQTLNGIASAVRALVLDSVSHDSDSVKGLTAHSLLPSTRGRVPFGTKQVTARPQLSKPEEVQR